MDWIGWIMFGVAVAFIISWFGWGWRRQTREERDDEKFMRAFKNTVNQAKKRRNKA